MQRDLGTALDIVLACKDIEEFIAGHSKEQFLEDKVTRYAVIHQLLVIGEAAKRLSSEFRNAHTEIPWKSMAGMRDRLVHRYDEIDFDEVWKVARDEVPQLRAALEPIIPPEEES